MGLFERCVLKNYKGNLSVYFLYYEYSVTVVSEFLIFVFAIPKLLIFGNFGSSH